MQITIQVPEGVDLGEVVRIMRTADSFDNQPDGSAVVYDHNGDTIAVINSSPPRASLGKPGSRYKAGDKVIYLADDALHEGEIEHVDNGVYRIVDSHTSYTVTHEVVAKDIASLV